MAGAAPGYALDRDSGERLRFSDAEFVVKASAGPGAVVFAPRGVPHAHRRLVPRRGRFLTMLSPAGFEGFFRELAEAERAGGAGPEDDARVSQRYGITWLDERVLAPGRSLTEGPVRR